MRPLNETRNKSNCKEHRCMTTCEGHRSKKSHTCKCFASHVTILQLPSYGDTIVLQTGTRVLKRECDLCFKHSTAITCKRNAQHGSGFKEDMTTQR